MIFEVRTPSSPRGQWFFTVSSMYFMLFHCFSLFFNGFLFLFRRRGPSQTTRGCATLGSGASPETEDEMMVR